MNPSSERKRRDLQRTLQHALMRSLSAAARIESAERDSREMVQLYPRNAARMAARRLERSLRRGRARHEQPRSDQEEGAPPSA